MQDFAFIIDEYDESVVFIGNGADDEYGVRRQPIAVVRCPLDKQSVRSDRYSSAFIPFLQYEAV